MAMRRAVSRGKRSPTILTLARSLAAQCAHKDRVCWAQRAYDFVRSHIAYVNHPLGLETVTDPDRLLALGAGDCDQQAVLFNALVESMGLRSWFKTIAANPQRRGEWSHVYSLVEIPGVGVLAADCTQLGASLGWEPTGGYESAVWPGSME